MAFVPIEDEQRRADDEPGGRAEQPRTMFCPVLSALERSTDSVPSTTQNACCTPVRFADEHGHAEPDRAADAVVQPDRMALDVCRGRSCAAASGPASPPAGGRAAAPPVAPLGRRGQVDVARDLRDDEAQLLRAEARVQRRRRTRACPSAREAPSRPAAGWWRALHRGQRLVQLGDRVPQRRRVAAGRSSRSAPRSRRAPPPLHRAGRRGRPEPRSGLARRLQHGVQPDQFVDQSHDRPRGRAAARSAGRASRRNALQPVDRRVRPRDAALVLGRRRRAVARRA